MMQFRTVTLDMRACSHLRKEEGKKREREREREREGEREREREREMTGG